MKKRNNYLFKVKGDLQRLGIAYKDIPKSEHDLAIFYAEKFRLNIKGEPKKWLARVTQSDIDFYSTTEWVALRRKAIIFYGCVCMKCGAENAEIHVDHIKPRSIYPTLALDFNNLQILCKHCNKTKSNKEEIDYRPVRAHSHSI